MLIVSTAKTDVYRNLALEEWLLNHASQLPVLFLYVNDPCVVIGKNQNPWRECRLSLMEKEGVPLARRISGGGAVYHDEGNLNFGVIVPRTEYREEKQYELIFQTLDPSVATEALPYLRQGNDLREWQKLRIQASRLRKNSLAVDGKKFSGQAFCFRGQHVLHHGTLLVNSDLDRLGRYLGSEIEGIQTKAVASVPSQVANLSSFAPGLTVETLSAALIETVQTMYAPGEVTRPALSPGTAGRVISPGAVHWNDKNIPEAELLPIIRRLSSNDWKLGRTPRFQVTLNGQALEVEKGCITNLESNSLFSEWLNARSAKQ